jgi:putative heme-binding domain-containing protein
MLNNNDGGSQKDKMLNALARVGSKESIDILQTIAFSDKYDMAMRKSAAHKIGNSGSGEDRVLVILKAKKVPAELIPDVVASVEGAWRGAIRIEAASYLPDKGKAKASKPVPTMQEIAALKPDVAGGQKVFTSFCSVCHKIDNTGNDFGPKLTEIGSKLPKEALLESIVKPSAGIGFGYEGWIVKMKDGSNLSGIISSKTETDIEMVLPGGSKKQIKTADVLALTQMKESMMTEGLYQNMTAQDLSNLLGYLESLKKK